MNSGKSLIVALGLGALIAGCDSAEREALSARQRQLEVILVEKQVIAQNLNELRRDQDVLEQQLAEVKAKLHRPDAAELAKLLASAGVKDLSTRDDPTVLHAHVAGDGGARKLLAALRALEPSASAILVRQLSVDSKSWQVELEVPAAPKPAEASKPEPAAARPALAPLPEPSLLSSSESKAMRERIMVIERRIAELDKVVGEAQRIAEKRKALKAELEALTNIKPGERLVGTMPVIERLFGGAKPMLAKGTARFEGARLTLTDLPKADAAKRLVALSEVGKVLQSSPEIIELEPAFADAATK